MKKTDCPDCMVLLNSFVDIPETLKRMRAVWEKQECSGAHTLDAWVENPTGAKDSFPPGRMNTPMRRAVIERAKRRSKDM